ncbi:MAG: hypothetical protein IJT41_01035 [Clostridia bacterium]|nr:hypothetical protein [Clostridia bacterium]
MFFSKWMSYLSDDAKLTQIVMPGAHNAGSYGMAATACCQDGTIYEQILSGVRHFCLRIDTTRKGIVMCHGLSKGDLFEHVLQDFKRAMEEFPSDVFILDLREYYPQKIGPFTLHYKALPRDVDALLDKYISPKDYAYCDFSHIQDVTIGDLRKAGKRYILLNYAHAYAYSVDCPHILPWDKKIYGLRADIFIKEIPKIFEREHTDGIYWFQTQQTPNPGTEVGLTTPRKLNIPVTKHFAQLMQIIADNPLYLRQANVIGGDFMTDGVKCREIIRLNLAKGLVRSECRAEFEKSLK